MQFKISLFVQMLGPPPPFGSNSLTVVNCPGGEEVLKVQIDRCIIHWDFEGKVIRNFIYNYILIISLIWLLFLQICYSHWCFSKLNSFKIQLYLFQPIKSGSLSTSSADTTSFPGLFPHPQHREKPWERGSRRHWELGSAPALVSSQVTGEFLKTRNCSSIKNKFFGLCGHSY